MAMRRMFFHLAEYYHKSAGNHIGFHCYCPTLLSKDARLKIGPNTIIVIDDMGCSPSADWALGKLSGGTNISIGVSYCGIQTRSLGRAQVVRGLFNPYPEMPNIKRQNDRIEPIVLCPGDDWLVELDIGPLDFASDNPERYVIGYVSYALYDGIDYVFANKLLEQGIAITPENVDHMKRKALEATVDARDKDKKKKQRSRAKKKAINK